MGIHFARYVTTFENRAVQSIFQGININSNFDFMFDTDDSNTCGDDYPGPSPDSAEVRAVMQFANEINSHKKEYEQVNYSP